MKKDWMNRRDFNRLTLAALGGAVAGTTIGCGGDAQQPAGGDGGSGSGSGTKDGSDTKPGDETAQVSGADCWTESDKHVCRGLNTCEGKGAGGENECAGMGQCANVAHHTCSGENACNCEGGCAGRIGENACKGQGGCHVPLEHGWEDVRKKFEAAMQAAGKEFGDAPEPAKS